MTKGVVDDVEPQELGYPRPALTDLDPAIGYVQRLTVEREDARDAALVRLETFRSEGGTVASSTATFRLWLDSGTVVAFSHVQDLLRAMKTCAPVLLGYFRQDGRNVVYYVRTWAPDHWDASYPDDPVLLGAVSTEEL